MNNELVSVIIPSYKRSEMLPRAVKSVLAQTYKNIEIIVVDDNDPDSLWRRDTEKRMNQFKNNCHVKYICHEKNKNGSVARNTGIKNASGSIIAFLDDDDEYLPTKIEKQVSFLLEHPEYKAVYSGWIRANKKIIPTHQGDLSYDILSGNNIIYTNVIMMWKKCAEEFGGWDESFIRNQEAAFLLRYFDAGYKIGVVSEALVIFDITDRSNVAANSIVNEKQMMQLINNYTKAMNRCETTKKGSRKRIICSRKKGIFLSFIKDKKYKEATEVLIEMLSDYPVCFCWTMLKYGIKRISGKNY